MVLLLKIPEVAQSHDALREAEVLSRKAQDFHTYSDEERAEFRERAEYLNSRFYELNNIATQKLREHARNVEGGQKMENTEIPEPSGTPTDAPVEVSSNEVAPSWPSHAKLVKERVALIEGELYDSTMNICRNDVKVAVSALGKVLARVRGQKKGE